MVFWCFTSQHKKQGKKTNSFKVITLNEQDYSLHASDAPVAFSTSDINEATGNFSPSRKIGQGGFGTVYYGKLRDGTPVAVKRAKKHAFEERRSTEFKSELNMLLKVEHLNLVKLLGYFEGKEEHVLVVEYVPNGNLRAHLDGLHESVLQFKTRLDIIVDVAHALTYLHYYADEPIIHRDVKSSNILLTPTFRAKVADFGFSRVGPERDATHVSTQVKGTAGYLDPEYLYSRQLTLKSDVYSFGILMLEILTGRRPIERNRAGDERVTIRWAWRQFEEGKIFEILDPKLDKRSDMVVIVERMAELAFRCAAPSKNDRPSMMDATQALCKIRKDYQDMLLMESNSSDSFFTTSASVESRAPSCNTSSDVPVNSIKLIFRGIDQVWFGSMLV